MAHLTHRWTLAVILLLAALLLAGCPPDETPLPTELAVAPAATPMPPAATHTSVPHTPTPAPTATPAPPSAQAILEAAAEAMADVSSYHFAMVMNISISGMDAGPEAIEMDMDFSGDVATPDRIQGRMVVSMLGTSSETEVIVLGDQSYVKTPESGAWQESPDTDSPLDPGELARIDPAEIRNPQFIAETTLGDAKVYHLSGATVFPIDLAGLGLGKVETELPTSYWIDVQDMRLVQGSLGGDIELTEPFPMTVTVAMTLTLSDYNLPVNITAPEETSTTAATKGMADREVVDAPGLVVFSQAQPVGADLFAASSSGTDPIRLTDSIATEIQARWSPDASRIAYLRYDPGTDSMDLWILDPKAPAAARPVTTHGKVEITEYVWMPDGQSILYGAPQADGAESDIYQLDIESGEVVTLTAGAATWDASPAPSPDGEWIAFVSDRSEEGKTLDDIWLMRLDGSDLVNLTDNGDAWEDVRPAWSPDSAQIAFFRWSLAAEPDTPGGPAGLWVMKADGSDQRLVDADVLFPFTDTAVWSPDGRLIAFASMKEGETDVWVISASGGEAINVSNLPGDDSSISWSPDSGAVTFTNETDESLSQIVAAADGSNTYQLVPGEITGYGEWSPAAEPVAASLGDQPSQCDKDETIAALKPLVPYPEFELGYVIAPANGVGTMMLWMVDPELETPATGATIEQNAVQARQDAVVLSHQLVIADPCVAELFPYINPAVVDANYNGWFSGLISTYAIPQTDTLSDEQAAAIVQRIGSEYLRSAATEQPEPAPEGKFGWSEVQGLLHGHFPENANINFHFIQNPDGSTVGAYWPGPSDLSSIQDVSLNLTALANVILELQRLHPTPDQLLAAVLDEDGMIQLIGVLDQEDILKGMEALESFQFQPTRP